MRGETAEVSRGTSIVTTKQFCITTSVGIQREQANNAFLIKNTTTTTTNNNNNNSSNSNNNTNNINKKRVV